MSVLNLLYLLDGGLLISQLLVRCRHDFTAFLIHILANLRYLACILLITLTDRLREFAADVIHSLAHL